MIIKLTKEHREAIDRTKTGADNYRLVRTEEILFNSNEMIEAYPNEYGGTTIRYKCALVDWMRVKETVEEIYRKINRLRPR